MRYAKKTAVLLQAWQLGAGTDKEKEMIARGKIRIRPDGLYELFSLESTGTTGELAQKGDYFKVDLHDLPYPNAQAAFEQSHVHVQDDWYRQKQKPLPIWTADEPVFEEIAWLLENGRLEIHEEDPAHYFSAFLWGTRETAARDAVVVIYDVERNAQQIIQQINFNFVDRIAFERTYRVLETPDDQVLIDDGSST